MATEQMKIAAYHVDSFQLVTTHLHKPGVCSFKGCKRMGRVKLFWRENRTDNQKVDWICVTHALELSNEILSHYKFDRAEFPGYGSSI